MKKKFIYVVFWFLVIVACQIILTPKTYAVTLDEVRGKLHQIRNTNGYMNGQTYVYYTGYSSDYCSLGTAWHGAHSAQECHAYGMDLYENIFHQCANCVPKSYDVNNLQIGDLVRINNDGHTIIVTDIVGDTVWYTDCNSDWQQTVYWDKTMSKSYLQSVLTFIRPAKIDPIIIPDPPTITSCFIEMHSITSTSYKVKVYFNAPGGVNRVLFPTWTVFNGQDDLGDWNNSNGRYS